MASKVTIEKGMQASRPILAFINKVASSFPKTTYVLYYKNHMHEDEEIFKNIQELKELFLPNHELHLKVVNFERAEDPIIIKNSQFECSGGKILISFKHLQFSLVLSGTVLNESESNEGLVNLSLSQKKGYDDFYKFRKKYKTLENITKKIDFQIDHRIRVVIAGKQHQFDLQDKKKEHYFLNLACFQRQITVVLEETTSIEDFIQVEKIEDVDVDMSALINEDFAFYAKVKFSNKFEVTLFFNLIKNQNLSSADFVAIRVLETSAKGASVKIGTEQTIHLTDCLKVQPLVASRYYDYEWGNLNENLSQIEGSSIYEFLNKITKSVPQYAHFANQEMVDLKSSNFVIFQIQGNALKVPIAYILKGFNHVECQKFSLKFFVDSSRLQQKTQSEKNKQKRIYQLGIQQIWSTSKLNKLLDKSNTNNFSLKIINEDTYYFIPFTRKVVSRSQFRKESKQLLMRNEITQMAQGKYFSLQNSQKNKEQLILIQSTAILPFYLIKSTSSSAISIQIIIANAIALEGSLSREKIVAQQGKSLIHLLHSIDGSSKIGIILNFTQISQPTDSAATYYNFRHKLYFAQPGESQETTYDIQISFEKDSKIKPLKSKMSPEVKREANDAVVLREFAAHSGVYRKQETLNFTIKLRKMHFNEQLNYFDNEALLVKAVSINPTADLIKPGSNVMVRLDKQCFEGLEFDLYDLNVKKRLKYYLEIYAQKSQFLDYKDSSYKIKIPSLLWSFNQCSKQKSAKFQITTHLNRKNKNKDSFSVDQLFTQEFLLDHYNYNDGLSIVESSKAMGYSKFLRAIKLKCDILKDKIGWNTQNEWFFSVISFPQANFYFLAQRMFDPYEDKKNKSSSSNSRKTVSRQRSDRSDKHKINPLAKTISNLDLLKLKQKKNELIAEGRQLTARYVKRQEKIVELTKAILELQQSIRKKEQADAEMKGERKKVKKENVKMKQFYRSICECGAKNPQFNGYCDACLKKLKQRYETYSKEYKEKCYQYEKMVFDKFNKKEKIQKIKKKIEHMKSQNVVGEPEDDGPHLLVKDLEEKSLKKAIEELKVEIFQIEEEKNSLVATSNWQMSILEQKIEKEDSIIYKASQLYDSLKNKLAQVVKTTRGPPKSDDT